MLCSLCGASGEFIREPVRLGYTIDDDSGEAEEYVACGNCVDLRKENGLWKSYNRRGKVIKRHGSFSRIGDLVINICKKKGVIA